MDELEAKELEREDGIETHPGVVLFVSFMDKRTFAALGFGVLLCCGFLEFFVLLGTAFSSGIIKCLLKHELTIRNRYIPHNAGINTVDFD